MKFLSLIAFVFLSFDSNAQIPDYFANDSRWNCAKAPSGEYANYNYYLNGADTIIAGNSYHQLWKKGYHDYGSWNTSYNNVVMYIRQDGRAFRYYDIQLSSDTSLADYNLSVGDSLKFAFHAVDTGFDTLAVQKIDSVLVGLEYRKQFYFDTLNQGVLMTEGIGYQLNENNISGEFLEPIGIPLGTSYFIFCYGQNFIPLWHSTTDTSNCNLDITVGLNDFKIDQTKMFPNPSSDQIQVNSSIEIHAINIMTMDGKQLLTSNESAVDISSLSKGLYIVTIKLINGSIYQKSLVVE
jgi:Secretion system C-terminal sorting domain